MVDKLENIVKQLMRELGIEINEHTKRTPYRIAKMLKKEVFRGLYEPKPKITSFTNDDNLNNMVIMKNITVKSMCEHHWMPFYGVAHVGYIPNDKIIGASKFSRLVDWLSRRPQVQERLTKQIKDELVRELQPKGVMVVVKAKHLCMIHRGVNEYDSEMVTSEIYGAFEEKEAREEFLRLINGKL